MNHPDTINDAGDLWRHAVSLVKGGEVSDPVALRSRLVDARDAMPSDNRPSEQDISAMVRAAMSVDKDAPGVAEAAPATKRERLPAPDGNELALAEYLAASPLNKQLRRAPDGGWMEWMGTHWRPSVDPAPLALQAAVRRAIAAGLERRMIDIKGLGRLESASAVRGIATLLKAYPSMWLIGSNGEIDPPHLLACPRGVLDLQTGEWLPHNPMRPITRCCPVDPGPACSMWAMIEEHLRACLGDLYSPVHRFIGASLRGLGGDRRFAWFVGEGADGKSTLAKLICTALGDYAATVPPECLDERSGRGAHAHELMSRAAGARLAFILEAGESVDWPRVKSITGGDELTTKRLHSKSTVVRRPPSLVVASNHLPRPPDRACAARLLVAKLHPVAEPDERLMEVIKTPSKERDTLAGACLSWMIAGCADFVATGLGVVPLYGHVPSGLDAAWDALVTAGDVVPACGWSSLQDFRRLLPSDFGSVHDRDVASFLRSKVQSKRFEDGRRYQMDVRLTHADAC